MVSASRESGRENGKGESSACEECIGKGADPDGCPSALPCTCIMAQVASHLMDKKYAYLQKKRDKYFSEEMDKVGEELKAMSLELEEKTRDKEAAERRVLELEEQLRNARDEASRDKRLALEAAQHAAQKRTAAVLANANVEMHMQLQELRDDLANVNVRLEEAESGKKSLALAGGSRRRGSCMSVSVSRRGSRSPSPEPEGLANAAISGLQARAGHSGRRRSVQATAPVPALDVAPASARAGAEPSSLSPPTGTQPRRQSVSTLSADVPVDFHVAAGPAAVDPHDPAAIFGALQEGAKAGGRKSVKSVIQDTIAERNAHLEAVAALSPAPSSSRRRSSVAGTQRKGGTASFSGPSGRRQSRRGSTRSQAPEGGPVRPSGGGATPGPASGPAGVAAQPQPRTPGPLPGEAVPDPQHTASRRTPPVQGPTPDAQAAPIPGFESQGQASALSDFASSANGKTATVPTADFEERAPPEGTCQGRTPSGGPSVTSEVDDAVGGADADKTDLVARPESVVAPAHGNALSPTHVVLGFEDQPPGSAGPAVTAGVQPATAVHTGQGLAAVAPPNGEAVQQSSTPGQQVAAQGQQAGVLEQPEAAAGQQGAASGQAGAVSGQPGAVSGQPGAVSGQPDAASGQAAAVSGQAAAVSGQPGAVSGQPDAASGQAAAVSGQPAAVSGQPGAVSGQPGAVSGQPATVSGQPGAVSGQPGAVSGQAAAVSGQPATVSGQPDAAWGKAAAVSGQAAAVSGQPGAVSGQPGAVSGQAATTGQPSAAETDIDEQREVARAGVHVSHTSTSVAGGETRRGRSPARQPRGTDGEGPIAAQASVTQTGSLWNGDALEEWGHVDTEIVQGVAVLEDPESPTFAPPPDDEPLSLGTDSSLPSTGARSDTPTTASDRAMARSPSASESGSGRWDRGGRRRKIGSAAGTHSPSLHNAMSQRGSLALSHPSAERSGSFMAAEDLTLRGTSFASGGLQDVTKRRGSALKGRAASLQAAPGEGGDGGSEAADAGLPLPPPAPPLEVEPERGNTEDLGALDAGDDPADPELVDSESREPDSELAILKAEAGGAYWQPTGPGGGGSAAAAGRGTAGSPAAVAARPGSEAGARPASPPLEPRHAAVEGSPAPGAAPDADQRVAATPPNADAGDSPQTSLGPGSPFSGSPALAPDAAEGPHGDGPWDSPSGGAKAAAIGKAAGPASPKAAAKARHAAGPARPLLTHPDPDVVLEPSVHKNALFARGPKGAKYAPGPAPGRASPENWVAGSVVFAEGVPLVGPGDDELERHGSLPATLSPKTSFTRDGGLSLGSPHTNALAQALVAEEPPSLLQPPPFQAPVEQVAEVPPVAGRGIAGLGSPMGAPAAKGMAQAASPSHARPAGGSGGPAAAALPLRDRLQVPGAQALEDHPVLHVIPPSPKGAGVAQAPKGQAGKPPLSDKEVQERLGGRFAFPSLVASLTREAEEGGQAPASPAGPPPDGAGARARPEGSAPPVPRAGVQPRLSELLPAKSAKKEAPKAPSPLPDGNSIMTATAQELQRLGIATGSLSALLRPSTGPGTATTSPKAGDDVVARYLALSKAMVEEVMPVVVKSPRWQSETGARAFDGPEPEEDEYSTSILRSFILLHRHHKDQIRELHDKLLRAARPKPGSVPLNQFPMSGLGPGAGPPARRPQEGVPEPKKVRARTAALKAAFGPHLPSLRTYSGSLGVQMAHLLRDQQRQLKGVLTHEAVAPAPHESPRDGPPVVTTHANMRKRSAHQIMPRPAAPGQRSDERRGRKGTLSWSPAPHESVGAQQPAPRFAGPVTSGVAAALPPGLLPPLGSSFHTSLMM